jgi:hypothetical protein
MTYRYKHPFGVGVFWRYLEQLFSQIHANCAQKAQNIKQMFLQVKDRNIFHSRTPELCMFSRGFTTREKKNYGAHPVKYISVLH